MTTSTAEGQRRGSIEIGEEKLLVLKAGKDAGFVEFAYLAPKHLKTQFEAICKDTIDNQTEYWLKSFVKEFEGKIDEVLELAEEFKAYLEEDADAAKATCLDEFQAHVFLERKGQTLSVRDLRAVMRNICAGLNCTRFSFIEYLVWSYQKTLKELFMVKPYDLAPLLKGLYQAMHDYQESKAQHDAKTEELEEAVAEAGDAKQVVRGLVAQAKLKEVLTRGGTRRQKDAVYHGYKQKKAQKQFEARKAAELAAKKAQDAVERKAARARMAAKMGANEGVAMANEADPAKTMHAPAEAAVTAAAPSSSPQAAAATVVAVPSSHPTKAAAEVGKDVAGAESAPINIKKSKGACKTCRRLRCVCDNSDVA